MKNDYFSGHLVHTPHVDPTSGMIQFPIPQVTTLVKRKECFPDALNHEGRKKSFSQF